MKTLKYMLMGVILSSLVCSSFSFYPSINGLAQGETVTFCETYTQQEVISKLDQNDPLYTWVRIEDADPESSRIGWCHKDSLDDLWKYIQSGALRAQLQEDLIIAPGAETKDQMIPLYAVRKSALNDALPLQEDIEEVSISKDGSDENYALLLTFSKSGADKWAELTRSNIGRDIAILFDGKVISAPRVREEIKGGLCMISGKFTEIEIQQLKAVFDK